MDPWALAVCILVLGLVFDYTNGFHDAANVVSTVIATRALAPLAAIVLAGLLNTIGALQVSAIVTTMTQGLVNPFSLSQTTIICALIAAIGWNIITWYYGLPSSSSYALIGGLVGATIQSAGLRYVLWPALLFKVFIPMVISPILGFCLSFFLVKILKVFHKKSKRSEQQLHSFYSNMQIGSASIVALCHGLCDAQKSMGIITLGLFVLKIIPTQNVPWWVITACALVMGLGTASGGMRIIKTVGFSITKLNPMQGFSSEVCASFVIFLSSLFGMPLSSTHMIVGSVSGSGAGSSGMHSVQIDSLKKIALAWLITFPVSAFLAGIVCYFISLI